MNSLAVASRRRVRRGEPVLLSMHDTSVRFLESNVLYISRSHGHLVGELLHLLHECLEVVTSRVSVVVGEAIVVSVID